MRLSGLGFLRLAGRRLISRPGLTLLSLLSIILAIGLVISIPVFSQGVSYLLLQEELTSIGRNFRRPPLTTRFYFITPKEASISLDQSLALGDELRRMTAGQTGLDISQMLTYVASPNLQLQPAPRDEKYTDLKENIILDSLPLATVTGIEERLEVVEGLPFGVPGDGKRTPVWMTRQIGDETGVQVGEAYDLVDINAGQAIPIVIAGIWQARDPADFYWMATTISWDKILLISSDAYRGAVEPFLSRKTGISIWYLNPDQRSLGLSLADRAARGLGMAKSLADVRHPGVKMDVSPETPLNRYLKRRDSLSALLVGFSLPTMGLLLVFLWMLSSITARFQQEEVAILSSRGAGRRFVVSLVLLETLILVGIGTPLGLGAGYGMARLMGLTSGFLAFARRAQFPATLLEVDWRLVGLALFLLILARVIPTLNAARAGIVQHLRQRSRAGVVLTTVQLLLDGMLVVVAYYAYRQLDQRGTLGIIGWEPSGDPFRDPLLLMAPSLFVFTAALLLTHLFPLLMMPLDRLGSKMRSFAAYMGLSQLHRQGKHYAGSLFLTMVCLSLGAFYASMALSLDQWLVERIYYRVGADYRFQQGVPPPAMGGPSGLDENVNPEVVNAWLLPVTDYLQIPGVDAATRVGLFDVWNRTGTSTKGLFMAIDRLDFPQVAFYRADFNPAPLGELMNRLGMYPNGVLVSRNFLRRSRLLEGQRIKLDISFNFSSFEHEFLIIGSYESFPTVYPEDTEVMIGNLDYLFEQVGDQALHQIWMKTEPDADSQTMVDRLLQMGIWPIKEQDTRALVIQDQEQVERIGLYGVLSVGFMAAALLASLGLLVYTYASLQGRLQQISVLRAMGIQTRLVLAMVGVEYVGVILYGSLTGAAIGIAAAYLFVPFFRVSGDPAFALPAFVRHIAWLQILWLTALFSGALLASQAVILYWVTRRDIFQILRMGQRE